MDMTFDWSVIVKNWQYVLIEGMGFTLSVAALVLIGSMFFGSILAAMRLSPNRALATCSWCYVSFARLIPPVLLLFWAFFFFPYVAGWVSGSPNPIKVSAFTAVVGALIFSESAYFCEIIRSGISGIPQGQIDAARSLGLTKWQALRHVVLPQSIRNSLPMLLTESLMVFQVTSISMIVSAVDFFGAANQIAQRDYKLVEMYVFVAVVYVVIGFSLSMLIKQFERNTNHRSQRYLQ